MSSMGTAPNNTLSPNTNAPTKHERIAEPDPRRPHIITLTLFSISCHHLALLQHGKPQLSGNRVQHA